MASQPQPLCPAVPCASAPGTGLAAGGPEKGTARPKPPVRPKPRMLPKPAVPAKPILPPAGPRPLCPELPSAEKMNRLAGPQPYGGGGAGGPLRRPSFTIRSPETLNGKGLPSPPVAVTEDPAPGEEVPPAPPTPSRKGPAPFKVTPVPVAAKPERFPGTTVEEILAKMDSREGPGSPDRYRLSPFSPDPSFRFGSKTFAAFRRHPSGEADGAPASEARRTPQPAVGEPGTEDNEDGHAATETSDSPTAGPRCAGDSCGHRRPPSPPDLPALQPGTLGPPGSPRPPACPAPAPGGPFRPAEPSASAPGSPDGPLELPVPGSPTLAPGSPKSLARVPAEVSVPAPGAPSPSAAEPQLGASRSPGSPHAPGEGSPGTTSPPGTPELPPRVTCAPGSPEAAAQYPAPPSPAPVTASCPPGSPEEPGNSLVSREPPEGTVPPSQDSGLCCSLEGVLQPTLTGQDLGVLGDSLSTLPSPRDPLLELALGNESNWSLSQSFEWTFPSQGARQPVCPPGPPIPKVAGSELSKEREDPAPGPSHSWGDSGSEGAPCPGGPMAQREAEGSAEEEEEKTERGAAVPHSPLCVMEPGQDPAEPHTEPGHPTEATPQDPGSAAGLASAWLLVGKCPVSLQGPGGPGHAEKPSSSRESHPDPGWLTELLASPGAHAMGHHSLNTEGLEDLLGWSRKDLHREFGVDRAQQAGAFDWSREAVAREREWPGETEQDRAFGTTPSWDSPRGGQDGDGSFSTAERDWGGSYDGTELTGDTRLGCSDWPGSHGTGEGCRRHRDFGTDKPEWGKGYGLGNGEIGTRQADWSVAHGQRRDEELSWAGRYGPGDLENRSGEMAPTWDSEYGTSGAKMKDEELTPKWATEYSSRDAEDKDFTLGWAGRCSTGDTGSPEKELSPRRPGWDNQYSTRDMESQDREFSPSRPAWTEEHSTGNMESQDREFSPSRPAWTEEHSTRNMESQDWEFSPSRPAWDDRHRTSDTETRERDLETREREFKHSRPSWDDRHSTRDVESQDQKFSPSRPAWTGEHSTGDTESQDREFSPGQPAKASEFRSGDKKTWDEELKPSRATWDDRYSVGDVETWDRDMESQDWEFSPRQPAWTGEHCTRDMESQDSGFKPSRATWDGRHGTRDVETQDRDVETQDRDVETQDQEFSPGRPVWDSRCSTRDVETRDRDVESRDWEFSPSQQAWPSEDRARDMESQDGALSPSRLTWASEPSSGEMETQESRFSPSRLVWDDRHSTRDVETWDRDMESQDQEFRPSRPAWDGRHGTRDVETRDRDMESQDQEFNPGRPGWDDNYSIGDVEAQDRDKKTHARHMEGQDQEFSPEWLPCASGSSSASTEKDDRELGLIQLSWAGGHGIGQTKPGGAGQDDSPGSRILEPPAQEPVWGSGHQQEHSATQSRDWAKELGGAQHHNQFGVIGTERVPNPSSAGTSPDHSVSWAGGTGSGSWQEPHGDWHGDLSFGTSVVTGCLGPGDAGGARPGQAWCKDLGSEAGLKEPGWSQDLAIADGSDAEAKRQEWASAFGARCAARSRNFSTREQSPGEDAGSTDGSIHPSEPSSLMSDALAAPTAAESLSPSKEERDPPEPPPSPGASPPLLEAASRTLLGPERQGALSDHPHGERPPSLEEKQLSLGVPQPEAPTDPDEQEFTFLEDTELLDSSVYRSKASLGRKRRHRAPALRPPPAPEGDYWIFRDSTEPCPTCPAVSDEDEESAEEPKSRRVRSSPLGRVVKVPLFPGLSTAALKAKLRGRNRSVEEGAAPGDSKGPSAKDPHVQRSKSCKIPSLSGKPPALPPKPEKSSGSEASPPHWLQMLKLKKKKP